MPRQTEPSANNAMGSLLQGMLPRSRVRSENTQAISGHPGLRPDILVTAPGRSPVVIEAEYMPAHTVEPEAKERLGLEVAANGRVYRGRHRPPLPGATCATPTTWHSALVDSPPRPTASSRRRPGARSDSRSPAGWRAPSRTWRTWSGWCPCRSGR